VVALDPDTKLKYFEIEWKDRPDWIKLAKTKGQELWASEYRGSYIDTAPVESSVPIETPVLPEFHLVADNALSRSNQRKRAQLSTGAIDQFERFQAIEEEEDVPDILAY